MVSAAQSFRRPCLVITSDLAALLVVSSLALRVYASTHIRLQTDRWSSGNDARFLFSTASIFTEDSSKMVSFNASVYWAALLERSEHTEAALRFWKAESDAKRLQRSLHGPARVERQHGTNPVVVTGRLEHWPYYGEDKHLTQDECRVPCMWSARGFHDPSPAGYRGADVVVAFESFDFDLVNSTRRALPSGKQALALWTTEPIFNAGHPTLRERLAGADFLVSYSQHSDVIVSYVSDTFPLGAGQAAFALQNPLPKPRGPLATFATFISSCAPGKGLRPGDRLEARDRLIRQLEAHGVSFDHYGACKFGQPSGRQLPLDVDTMDHTPNKYFRKTQIHSLYKFTLSLENTVSESYVTEKFFMMHFAENLPVYLGSPNAAGLGPPNSFVNVLEHSPRQLAKLLKQLARDNEAYRSYFSWRGAAGADSAHAALEPHYEHLQKYATQGGFRTVCELCTLYHQHHDFVGGGQ